MDKVNANPPSIRKAFDFAWGIFSKNTGLFAAWMLTFFASWVILETIVISGERFGIIWWLVAHISFFIVFAGLEVGFIQLCLAFHDGQKAAYLGIFQSLHLGVGFFVAQLTYIVTTLIGLVLLVVPGVYFGTRYTLFGYCFAEGHSNPMQSFRQSAVTSQGSMRFLFLFSIVTILLNILGAGILGMGLIASVPMTALMKAYVYRRLPIDNN